MTLRFLTTTATALTLATLACRGANLVTYPFNGNLDATTQEGVTASGFLANGGSDAVVGLGSSNGSYGYILITENSTNVGNAVSNQQFAQFTVTAPKSSGVQLAQLQFIAARGGDSTPRGLALRWSFDNYKSNLGQVNITTTWPSTKSYTININAFVGTSVTFRLYAFAQEISKAQPSIRFDNLVVTGSQILYAPVVTPASTFIETTKSSATVKGTAFASTGIRRVEYSRAYKNGTYSGANGTTNWNFKATNLKAGKTISYWVRAISNDNQVGQPVRVRIKRTSKNP